MTWKLGDGRVIDLVTPDLCAALTDGTVLIGIDGRQVVKGKDLIDSDTHYGFLAYGVLSPEKQP